MLFFHCACTAVLLLVSTKVGAQQNSTAAGSEASGASGTVSYSIGQVEYNYVQSATHNINQGVQQPYEFFTVQIAEPVWNIGATVFPNPSTNDVFLEIKDPCQEGMSYELYDAQGKLIFHQAITVSKTIIHTAHLEKATYFLDVTLKEQKLAAFKLIKN